MKKLIILIITILILITGCYDNVELNELSIISGIGIDYANDEYLLTYEILNDNKSENTGELLSDTISGTGKTISDAFCDVNNKTSKKDFFAHLKLLVLSESVINGHLKQITDYLIRDTDIRDEFLVIISNNNTPEEILSHNNFKYPVASEYIVKLINNEKYNNSLPTKEIYMNILSKLISKDSDIALNSISIIDDHLSLNDTYIFNGYNMVTKLDKHLSSLYTLLNKNNPGIEYTNNYNGEYFVINICNVKTDIDVLSDKINITANLEAKILENNSNLNLKDSDTYNMLNQDFSKLIKEDILKFVKELQHYKSDILEFEKIYYKSHNKENKNLWLSANINVKVDLKINYKGFIFEVENEK